MSTEQYSEGDIDHLKVYVRIELQRSAARGEFGYSDLEAAVPPPLLKEIEDDWRKFIRADEQGDFHGAFQRAVALNLPGVHKLVVAAEFLYGIHYHQALGYLLDQEDPPAGIEIDDGRLFGFFQALEDDERRYAEAHMSRKGGARSRADTPSVQKDQELKLPILPEDTVEDQTPFDGTDRPALPQRRKFSAPELQAFARDGLRACVLCSEIVPETLLASHLSEKHLNWKEYIAVEKARMQDKILARHIRSIPRGPSVATGFRKSLGNGPRDLSRCIFCGGAPIPGDFMCYVCKTE